MEMLALRNLKSPTRDHATALLQGSRQVHDAIFQCLLIYDSR